MWEVLNFLVYGKKKTKKIESDWVLEALFQTSIIIITSQPLQKFLYSINPIKKMPAKRNLFLLRFFSANVTRENRFSRSLSLYLWNLFMTF